MNVAIVRGRLSSTPRRTELDSGDVLVRFEVTVPRPDEAADSVPVSWIGAAKAAPPELDTGDEVFAVGRVRRRWFRTPQGTASRTEVAATTVVPAGRRATVRKAFESALAASMEALGE